MLCRHPRFDDGGLPLSLHLHLQTPLLIQLVTGFQDPWSADDPDDATLDNPAWRYFGWSLMKGKLDWMLLRRLTVVSKDLGNHDYSASDHKLLFADVKWG